MIREQTTDRAPQVRETSERIRRAGADTLLKIPDGLCSRASRRRAARSTGTHEVGSARRKRGQSVRGQGGSRDAGPVEKSGQIGGHTGKEVRVPRAGRRGGFAPVSPGGFIEPHTAWYGVPATVLYAMYQNAADPRPSRYRRRRRRRRRLHRRRSFANCNAVMETFFILNLPSPVHFRCEGRPFARPSLARSLTCTLRHNGRIIGPYFKRRLCFHSGSRLSRLRWIAVYDEDEQRHDGWCLPVDASHGLHRLATALRDPECGIQGSFAERRSR